MRVRRRYPGLPRLLWAIAACALMVVAFFMAPVEPDATGTGLAVRAVLSMTVVAVLAVVISRLAIQLARAEAGTRPANLLIALFGGLVLFAFIDYLLAVGQPGQFVGMETKVDAFYFAVTTLVTVGYGDVYASGQIARVVVTVQQLFNLAVLATGGTVLVNRLTSRPDQPRPSPLANPTPSVEPDGPASPS